MAKARQDDEAETVSKTKAVREALEELGYNTGPGDIQEFVFARYGLEIEKNVISSLKSTALKKIAAESGQVRVRGGLAPAAAAPKPGEITVGDIRAVKQMLDRFGPDRLLELIGAICDG
jgi:hypothetical protein